MPRFDPLEVGRRVVVRYRLPEGSGPPLTDVVGVVSAADDATISIDGTRGPVTVRRADIVLAKAVPPRPVRRGPPHTSVGISDLERLLSEGWRAVEEEWDGEWLLRASSGFTSRANSVLPLGDPRGGLEAAVVRAEGWYAARRLPPSFSLPRGTADEAADPLRATLAGRGYREAQPTLVMTAATSDIEAPAETGPAVTAEATLSRRWLDAYSRQRTIVPGVAEQVLTSSQSQLFVSMGDPPEGPSDVGAVSAVARMSVHPGWAAVQGLWVARERRQRGLGRAMLRAVGVLARERGLSSMVVQVEVGNDAARALYESEGFGVHHEYSYAVRPD